MDDGQAKTASPTRQDLKPETFLIEIGGKGGIAMLFEEA